MQANWLMNALAAGIRDHALDVSMGREGYALECAYCGRPVQSNEWGGACRECGCREPEYVEQTPELVACWLATAETVLAANPDAPSEQREYLLRRCEEWRALLLATRAA